MNEPELKQIEVLLVEDNPTDSLILQEALAQSLVAQFKVSQTEQLSEAIEHLNHNIVDVILLDLGLPDSQGLATLLSLRHQSSSKPIIIFTGLADETLGLKALQQGAQDYLIKGWTDGNGLARAIRYAIERGQSEARLRQGEAFNRAVLNSLWAHIAVLDQAGAIIAVNQTWEEFARNNGDPALAHTGVGINYLEICRKATGKNMAEAETVLAGLQAVLDGTQTEYQLEYPCHSPTENRWFLLHVLPLTNGYGGLVVSHTNITERKQTEAEIHRRNRELAMLNEIIAASASGREPEEMLNIACRELALAFDLPQTTATLLTEEKTAARVVAEYRAKGQPSALGLLIPVRRTPTSPYILQSEGPLVINDVQTDPRLAPMRAVLQASGVASLLTLPLHISGEMVGSLSLEALEPRTFSTEEINLAWSVADQVAGALARARLVKQHQRLSIVVEQSVESVIITDTQGVITYVNPTFERVSGYSRAEAVGQTMQLVRSGEQEAAFFEELWATLNAGKVWQGRFVNRRKDGNLYTEDALITPVRDEGGAIINYVRIQRDITSELQREEQYRQMQKMEAIGQLSGGVAHDFNNLLVVITGYSELILNRHLDEASPIRKYVEEIMKAGERAAALTQQLLAFSRKQVLQPKVLDLNEVVVNLEKMLRRLIGEDIDLITKLRPAAGQVKADPGQIEQIILNLAVNARDAMPRGGKLIIETANIELDETYTRQHIGASPGLYVMLAVSDTGAGMNAATQARIFEPFFTTKEPGKGTGLGLATVYGIVKQSGGDIWVYSELGHGATFKIYLPRVDEAAPTLEPPSNQPLPHGVETILLVEDEEIVRRLARQVLELNGYTVLEAKHGAEALEVGRQRQPIHLLLTDLIMPGGLNGHELAEQFEQLHPKIKVLYMSGYTDDAVVHYEALAAEFHFLQKPFTPAALTKKVRQVLDTAELG